MAVIPDPEGTPVRSSLVINLAPSDVGLCEHTVPHQLRQFGSEVDEILLVVDGLNSGGRFGEDWTRRKNLLESWLGQLSGVRIIEVDYAESARACSAGVVGIDGICPIKDFRGGPYHAYFHGVASANCNIVFHADSDMLFGGSKRGWLKQAIQRLQMPNVLAVSPLPGPPTADGRLLSQSSRQSPSDPFTHHFDGFSTRVFIIDRTRLRSLLGTWQPSRPRLRSRVRAAIDGRPAIQLPEVDISTRMVENALVRVDFLGSPATRWSLHPPYRSAKFLVELPGIIERVESAALPSSQAGHHDINDDCFDWTEARETLRSKAWFRRAFRRAN